MKSPKIFDTITFLAEGKLQMIKAGICQMEAEAQE